MKISVLTQQNNKKRALVTCWFKTYLVTKNPGLNQSWKVETTFKNKKNPTCSNQLQVALNNLFDSIEGASEKTKECLPT